MLVQSVEIAEANDRLNRQKLVDRLAEALGDTEILHCWLHPATYGCSNSVSWGYTYAISNQGGRDRITSHIHRHHAMGYITGSRKYEWHKQQCFEGLGLGQTSYMDDEVLWASGVEIMEQRLAQLAGALADWGLELNIAKCQLYL